MEWVNITAKTLPEAIDLALDNLGVDEAEAEIEVLEEPRQGLFGRTRGNARVRARVKPRSSRPKVERTRQRRRRNEGGGGGRGNERGGKSRSRRSGRDGSKSGSSSDGDRDREPSSGGGGRSSDGERPAKKGAAASAKDSSGRGGANESRGGEKQSNAKKKDGAKKRRKDEAPVEEASMEEVRSHLETFVGGLTEAFGFDDGVTVDDDGDDGLIAKVNGRHGLMVGPKGRTLDAIQELARVSAQRTAPSSIRIKVDVGGYREVRAEALRTFAVEAAEAALADGLERSLEPMNAADRKVVHDAVTDVAGIETRSVGADPRRRVVLVPTVDAAGDATSSDESTDGADDADDAEVIGS